MRKVYVSWADICFHVNSIIRQMSLDNWKPDVVVGITRGGLLPATMISNYFDIPMVALGVSLRDDKLGMGSETNCWLPEMVVHDGKKILIVDDINDTGATINWIANNWDPHVPNSIKWEDTVRFATLYDNLSSKADLKVSYSAVEINKAEDDVWLVFPWEFE